MSKDNVKLFYEAMAKDKVLQEKFRAVSQKYEGQKPDEGQLELIYQKELVPLAKQAGFIFTITELKQYTAAAKKPAMRKISEEELAGVAGGVCFCSIGGGGHLGGNTCACVIGGGGSGDGTICACVGAGSG
jgi:hypothetical protein